MKTIVFRKRDSERLNTWAVHLPVKEREQCTGFEKLNPYSVGIIDNTKLVFDPKTRKHVLQHNIVVDNRLCKTTRKASLFYMFHELISSSPKSIVHVSTHKLLAFGLQCKMSGFIDGLVAKAYGANTSLFVTLYRDDENMDALQHYQKESNCDFALVTTFQGAVCYVIENIFKVDTSIQHLKINTCFTLVQLFMKDAKHILEEKDTALMNTKHYTYEANNERAEEAHILVALGSQCHVHLERRLGDDLDDLTIAMDAGTFYFIPPHSVSCVTLTSTSKVQFVHIIVNISTSKKRKHELMSEVTCLVRDATIIKSNPNDSQTQSQSQSSVEEISNHHSHEDSMSQSVLIKQKK